MTETESAQLVLSETYGATGELSVLPGEFDANFLVKEADGQRSILKIMHAGCPVERVERQCHVLEHLAGSPRGFRHPRVLETVDGTPYARIEAEGSERLVWRLSYCPGTLFAKYSPKSPRLLQSLGKTLGELTDALETIEVPDFVPDHPWRLTHALDVRSSIDSVEIGSREVVRAVLGRFEASGHERLEALPHQIVHNDANDYNLLVQLADPENPHSAVVDGLFDFGDLCRQPAICELAIGATYALLDQPDPIWAAIHVVRGYSEERRLREEEAELLFELIQTRLAMSLAIASERMRSRPDEPYLAISMRPVAELLSQLESISPEHATARLRHAAGLDPVTGTSDVVSFLRDAKQPFEAAVRLEGHECWVDLGSGSSMLGADPANRQLDRITQAIDEAIESAGAVGAIGRWAESRAIYTAPAFAEGRHPIEDARTHHLGLDVFCPAGTPIHAPLDGAIEIATINDQPLDYGGLIILRHETPGGDSFYTIYGHLSHESIGRHAPGDTVRAGEEIARLGDIDENGGWTPHLHIQVAIDLLGFGADFPGVSLEREAGFWQAVSPNPERLLGFRNRANFDGRTDVSSLRRRREASLGSSLSLSYTEPIHAVRGFGQFLYDSHARAYLDLYNNVPHVGHSHPRVVEAVQRQIALLNTNTRYLHETILDYAERLTQLMPDSLSVCFFVNSGSEANELAIRLAQAATGRRELLVAEGAYHGHTASLIDASPYKHDGPGGSGAPDWVHTVPNPDDFRGRWKRDDPEAGARYAELVGEACQIAARRGTPIGAFLSETYPSVAGQIVPPAGYVPDAYRHARDAGAVVIADEIQTGFGRLGDAFWGFEAQGAVPDIVALGKPIANGFPMGAVVTTHEIAGAFDNGMEFFSTFGGNPVACAAANAVLDVVEDEGMQEHARITGPQFIRELGELRDEFPLIGDVRGQGLFLGVELIRDRETLEPADWETQYVVDRLRDSRILTGVDGVHHNVVKIRPSMAVGPTDLTRTVQALRAILGETPVWIDGASE